MNRLLIKLGLLPPIIEWLGVIAFIVVFSLLTGCATAEKEENPTNQMDARAAQALALSKIGESATDGETKRLALFAVAMLGSQSKDSNPQVQPVPRTVGEAVLTVLDRTMERLFGIVPSWFAYRGQVRASQTTETVAAINRDVSLNQSNNFLGLGVAGIQGTAIAGVAGVNGLVTVANKPQTPTTLVQGNAGPVNLYGTQTNSSNNPVNPNPTVCTPTATGFGCTR